MAKKSLVVLVAARWELPKPTEKAESNLHGRAASDFCRNAVQIRETAWPPRKADDGGVGSVHFRRLCVVARSAACVTRRGLRSNV